MAIFHSFWWVDQRVTISSPPDPSSPVRSPTSGRRWPSARASSASKNPRKVGSLSCQNGGLTVKTLRIYIQNRDENQQRFNHFNHEKTGLIAIYIYIYKTLRMLVKTRKDYGWMAKNGALTTRKMCSSPAKLCDFRDFTMKNGGWNNQTWWFKQAMLATMMI